MTGVRVSPELGVLNGAATFITLADSPPRPHEVHLQLPASWSGAATGLPPSADGQAGHFLAADYDVLVDSPIVMGDLETHTFTVQGVRHELVDVGERTGWDGAAAAADLERIVEQSLAFCGTLPYERYVFLNVFRQGRGGLEHMNSTLLTVNATWATTPRGYRSWLSFAAHEYFHAFNVKRLRPAAFSGFDYETAPRTPSLWLAEGGTTYFGNLLVARAGLMSRDEYLASLSGAIRQLQGSPGRLLQTVEQSSLEVWTNSTSGVAADSTTVSYYVKGHVVAFLLDARIQRSSDGRHTLQHVMRLAYRRYGGERGFTPEEFQSTAEELAGADLEDFFDSALRSTEELEYDEALDWFGLRFADDGSWRLQERADATDPQRARLRVLLAPAT